MNEKSVASRIYKNLAKLLGLALAIVGALALYGGTWAHGYVHDQLAQEKITMPSGAQLTNDTMKNALSKYAGQQMTTGPQAKAFANDYILEHMMASSGGKTYEEVSGEYMAMGKANPKLAAGTASASEMAAYQKLGAIRQNLFMGDSLRGMLLTAYAWWTVGTIAIIAGITLLVLGLLMLLYGLLGRRHHADADRDVQVVDSTRTTPVTTTPVTTTPVTTTPGTTTPVTDTTGTTGVTTDRVVRTTDDGLGGSTAAR